MMKPFDPDPTKCRCEGTGWVEIKIPGRLWHVYGRQTGWAGCNIDEHRLNAGDELPKRTSRTGRTDD